MIGGAPVGAGAVGARPARERRGGSTVGRRTTEVLQPYGPDCMTSPDAWGREREPIPDDGTSLPFEWV